MFTWETPLFIGDPVSIQLFAHTPVGVLDCRQYGEVFSVDPETGVVVIDFEDGTRKAYHAKDVKKENS